MKTNKNDQAFPLNESENHCAEFGLSKREYFAAMAMQGIMSNPSTNCSSDDDAALAAVSVADALILELNEESK